MLDNYLKDQSLAYKILLNSVKKNKISHAYLFETNNYQSGFDMALAFAKYLLCPNHIYSYEESICSKCQQCHKIDQNESLDLKIIDSDGLWIKKEQLDNLQSEFNKKSFNGGNQVYIINHAEKLNTQSANSILKFLEEPVPNIVAILVVNNKYSLLDTIVSRCQIIALKDGQVDICQKMQNEKVAYHLFNNQQNINSFLDSKKNEEIINKVIEFVNYYENNGVETLLFSNKLWHSLIKEKDDILNAFGIMLLYYKDILNYKVKGILDIFDFNEDINFILKKNTESKICDKINLILKCQEKVKYNVNTLLLIDKLIIEMEKMK